MNRKIRNLDNSAKIFPLMSTKKYSSVFRASVCINEEIKQEILQRATEKALDNFESFKVRLTGGFFWYYYAKNEKRPIVKKEDAYPCKYIVPEENNDYLFRVTYKQNKINIDIFHALTDGNSGLHFLKEIVYYYLDLSNNRAIPFNVRKERKFEYNTEDSYMKHYDKKIINRGANKRAYILKGKKMQNPKISVIYQKICLEELQQKSKQNNVTVTQYLTAVLIYSIYQTNYKIHSGKRPIKVCIPVDLRKYFKSKTINNFFSYITVEANIKKIKDINFNKIIELVKQEFEKKLTEKEVKKTMSANVKIGNNIFISIVPLFLKKLLVKLSYIEIRKYTTITLSNIGRIGIIGKYNEFINKFTLLIAPEPVEKIKCSSCSYNNQLIFTFTSTLADISIQEKFYEILKQQNIKVEMETESYSY